MGQPHYRRVPGSSHRLYYLRGHDGCAYRVDSPVVYAHPGIARQHPLACRQCGTHHPGAWALPGLGYRTLRISRPPYLGMGARAAFSHADLRTGVRLCPSPGNGRTCRTVVAGHAGIGGTTALPQSFLGVTLIMALDTFPFVYLLVRGALLNLNLSFEEVARVCGVAPWATLWKSRYHSSVPPSQRVLPLSCCM